MLSEKQIHEFQRIWKKKFGEEIDRDFALEKATKLIEIIKLVYRPIKKN